MDIPSGGNPLPARCSCASPVGGQEFAKFGLILGPGLLSPGLLGPGGLWPLRLLSPGLLRPGLLCSGLLLWDKFPGHRRLLWRAVRGKVPTTAAIAPRVATAVPPPIVEAPQTAVDAIPWTLK